MKTYNYLLELSGMADEQREKSLRNVFDRDIANNHSFKFRTKPIYPTPKADGEIAVETLFAHLITTIIDERHREFDIYRAERLHWIKFHVEEKKKNDMLLFSVQEPRGIRTYIYDKSEKYVIILEPRRNSTAYYLLTAYQLRGKDAQKDKMLRKYNRRLEIIY